MLGTTKQIYILGSEEELLLKNRYISIHVPDRDGRVRHVSDLLSIALTVCIGRECQGQGVESKAQAAIFTPDSGKAQHGAGLAISLI